MRAEEYARARELFHELCEQPLQERERRLAALDLESTVRAALQAMLERDAVQGALDRSPPGEVLRALLQDEGDSGASATRLGEYELLRRIGSGGMGVVYEARRNGAPDTLAVKVLRAGLDADQHRRRFQREARLLASLRHPGIARFLDAGHAPFGSGGPGDVVLPYLAMERVQGLPLLDHCRERGLDLRQCLELFARVCDAVHHAHGQSVIHRDLKPSNVLVIADPRSVGQPKVLDFGVARVAGLDSQSGTVTGTGALIGTLPYMSPEQAGGAARDVDVRSDEYSLGVMLYELITGRLPYDVRGLTLVQAAQVIREQDPTPVSRFRDDVTPELDLIVARSLEKERRHRYPDVGALAADLRRFLAGERIVARRASWSQRLVKFARRNRALVAGVIGTMAALLIGLVFVGWLAVREGQARRDADALRQQADANAARSERNAYRANLAAAVAALEGDDVFTARRNLEAAPPTLRGWEWSYLRARLDDSVAAVSVPTEQFRQHVSLAVAADGAAVRSVGLFDKSGDLWLTTWRWREEDLTRRKVGLRSGGFLGAGGSLFVTTRDVGFRMQDAAGGGEREVAAPPTGYGFVQDTARRWTLFHAGGNVHVHESGEESSTPLANAPRSKSGLAVSGDGRRFVFLVPDGLAIGTLPERSFTIQPEVPADSNVLALSADGRLLATCKRLSATPRLWHVDDDVRLSAGPWLVGAQDRVLAIGIDPTTQVVATGGEDQVIRLWDASSGAPLRTLRGHSGPVRALAYSRDGRLLASYADGTGGGELRVWEGAAADPFVRRHDEVVLWCEFTADDRHVFAGGTGPTLTRSDTSSGLRSVDGADLPEGFQVLDGAVDPAGDWLAVVADSARTAGPSLIRVLDSSTGRQREDLLTAPRLPSTTLAASHDGTRLAATVVDQGVVLWETAGWTELGRAPGSSLGSPSCVAWSPDDRILAVSGRSREVLFLDPIDLGIRQNLAGPDAAVTELAFSRDGRWLAAASRGPVVRLWDLRRLDAPPRDLECAGEMRALAFSPDGRRLFTGGKDRALHVWNVESGTSLASLRGHQDTICALDVSADGEVIVSASVDRTVRVHTVQPRGAAAAEERSGSDD